MYVYFSRKSTVQVTLGPIVCLLLSLSYHIKAASMKDHQPLMASFTLNSSFSLKVPLKIKDLQCIDIYINKYIYIYIYIYIITVFFCFDKGVQVLRLEYFKFRITINNYFRQLITWRGVIERCLDCVKENKKEITK